MSVSNSQSGGKTTIFQKENLISSLPNTKVKNTLTKSLTKNKSKFDVDLLIKQFEERKNFLIDFFSSISQFEVINPEGAFYLFVGCEGFIQKKTPLRIAS